MTEGDIGGILATSLPVAVAEVACVDDGDIEAIDSFGCLTRPYGLGVAIVAYDD